MSSDVKYIIREISDNLHYKKSIRNIVKARALYEDNRHLVLNINDKSDSLQVSSKIVSQTQRKFYSVKFDICKDEKILTRTSCACLDYKKKSLKEKTYMCKHVIVVIFRFFDELLRENYFKGFESVMYRANDENQEIISNFNIESKIIEINDYLDFTFEIEGMSELEVNLIIDSLRLGKKFIKIDNNRFIDLSGGNSKEAIKLIGILDNVKEFDKNNSIRIHKNKSFYLADYINGNACSDNTKEFIKRYLLGIEKLKNAKFEVPSSLDAKLRDYQIEGYNWFKTLSSMGCSGILADEMGLGKTVQTIAYILSEKNSKTLIVTPTSLIYNWQSEFLKFAKDVKVLVIHGTKAERKKLLDKFDFYDVVIISYGTLKNDFDFYGNKNFDIMIIDEAQNIKNPSSKSSIFVKNIRAKSKFALTGTPIENNLLELWSIFDYAMSGYLFSKGDFKNKFMKSENNYELLGKLISPFVLRREKKNVLKELPDKIEKKFFVELSKQQKKVYSAYVKKVKTMVKDESNKIEVLSYIMKLRQLCLEPNLVVDDYEGGNSKLDITIEMIDSYSIDNHKILIFSSFIGVLKSISEKLIQKNIDFSYIDGSISASDRTRLVEQFNSDSNKKVFLISLKAGGTGLNITSADIVIHYDPWWNLAAENQASDRAHRIGQKNNVEVIKLISKGTIEEKIINLQESKKDIIEKVMTGKAIKEGILSSLSEKELLELF